MKPRRLIEAKESAGAELALALERIAALEARQDRAEVVSYSHNERISALEGEGAHLEVDGWTVRGFAARVRRSPSTIRKLIAQGRIPVLPRMGVHPITAPDATRRRRRG